MATGDQVSGWLGKVGGHHDALALPPDDNDEHPWACECGTGQTETTHGEALDAVADHLEWAAMSEAPCVGLPPGQHWYELVVAHAHAMAGDDEKFPAHLTKADRHALFVSARAQLAEFEPAGLACAMCCDWERDIGIAP